MEAFLYKMDSHSSHGDQWCILSTDSRLPVCIACLVEDLEEQSLTKVQKQFKLSLLSNMIKENEEALQLFRENPLVCQHVLEMMTDLYGGDSFLTDSVQICVQLLDALQSEELYVYLLDKFRHQVQTDSGVYTFVVDLLGKLSAVSSAYVLTLILTHEHLLHLLLERHNSSNAAEEACSCSLLFLLIRLMDVDVLPTVPPSLLPLLERCMLRCLTSARPENVHLNAVALLKCLLRADCCCLAGDDGESWTELILGLKRLFVSKKQTLVIAATQCLALIASVPRHLPLLCLVLDGDLSEFLFESLHTTNGAQLETVFKCLLLFSEHEQFYKKCHAVYGLESIVRSLDVLLETHNVKVIGDGFSLLSNILQRQPTSIPMFVNVSTAKLTLSVVSKGVRCCQAVLVVLPALTAATALFKDSKVSSRQHQQLRHYRQTIVEAALTQVNRLLTWSSSPSDTAATAAVLSAAAVVSTAVVSSSGATLLPSLTDLQLLTALLSLLTSAATLKAQNEDQDVERRILEICRDKIVPYFSDHFTTCDDATLRTLFTFFNTLYKTQEGKMQEISEKALASGLAVQALLKKLDFRTDLELLSSASSFVESMFQELLKEDFAQCRSVPDYLRSGLRQLSLKSSIHQTVSELWNEDAAAALCMLLYFSCLNKLQFRLAAQTQAADRLCSPLQVGQVVHQLHEKGVLQCTLQRPLTTKFLLYLVAFVNSSEEAKAGPSLQSVERAVVQLATSSEQSVDRWATPHPHVFIWVFDTPQRARELGTALLEHWLLHTKGTIPAAGDAGGADDTEWDQFHVVYALFLNPHFRTVLFNLVSSSSQEISVLSRKLFVTLTGSNTGRSEEQSLQLIGILKDEVMSQFQRLFVLSVQPLRHVVSSSLHTLMSVMQHPMCEPSEADHSRHIAVVHHLVHYLGTADSADSELLYTGMATLDCLSKTTDEEQDRTVVPILLQNVGFLQQLERCLHKDEQQNVALSVAAWISSSCSDCQTDWPIPVSADFVVHIVAQTTSREVGVAALKILYLSLSPDLASPLSFQGSPHTLHHQPGELYTPHQLRLLVAYVQQYVCSEDRGIQFYAVKCYLELLNYSKMLDSALGDHLLHHPWNPQMLHFVLTNTTVTGLEPDTAEFIHQIWSDEHNGGDTEVARLVWESVLATEISLENHDVLQLLVQKTKTNCQDNDLREQAALKLADFENTLSFSQNTLLST